MALALITTFGDGPDDQTVRRDSSGRFTLRWSRRSKSRRMIPPSGTGKRRHRSGSVAESGSVAGNPHVLNLSAGVELTCSGY
jgi:hypothetical protein